MVQECYQYVDAVTDLTIKLRLIDTLRTVTAGKVWKKKLKLYCVLACSDTQQFLSYEGQVQHKYKCSIFRVSLLMCAQYVCRQIYVEIERARLTKTLANIKEQSGDVKEAASILQELQVRD